MKYMEPRVRVHDLIQRSENNASTTVRKIFMQYVIQHDITDGIYKSKYRSNSGGLPLHSEAMSCATAANRNIVVRT